jgi:HK97 family phage major capsid protein
MALKTKKNGGGTTGGAAPAQTPLEMLQNRLEDLADEAKTINNTAEAENARALTDEEHKRLEEIDKEFAEVEAEIDAKLRVQKMQDRAGAPNQRRVAPDDLEGNEGEGADGEPVAAKRPARSITGGMEAGAKRGGWGFRDMGSFCIAAKKHALGKHDQRILNAPTTSGTEGVNQDGGFLVPPDFRQEIMQLLENEDELSGRCDQQFTKGNSMELPIDDVSPWDTSNGVQVYWTGEGQPIGQSKPNLKFLETKVHGISALVPVSGQLLEDAPSLTTWLNGKVPQKLNSELNNVIISGNGNAKPTGLLKAGSLVTQAAEGGQASATFLYANAVKMWARLPAKCRKNAIWLINQDLEPQMQQFVVPGTSPSYPAYLPPGGLSAMPYGTLLGRPVVAVEECSALGTVGDVILADLTQYLLLMKTGGFKSDVSIHLYFDTGHVAFRFEMRVGGQSYWPTPVARKNGSNTLSPIVALAAR